jgi:hypothetical protein
MYAGWSRSFLSRRAAKPLLLQADLGLMGHCRSSSLRGLRCTYPINNIEKMSTSDLEHVATAHRRFADRLRTDHAI